MFSLQKKQRILVFLLALPAIASRSYGEKLGLLCREFFDADPKTAAECLG